MIEAVRGTQDWLPEQVLRREALQARLQRPMASAGYEAIELPFLEHRELYLKKSGEELVGKLYDFSYHGRALALRPEWTASVLRSYIQHLRGAPLPVRLRYAGPVFRYERPRRDTYRQFTQVGVELLGAAGPAADAEVLSLAVEGLQAAGVERFRLAIGHIGLVREVLASLDLEERTRSLLIWSMERLRNNGVTSVREQLLAMHSELQDDLAIDLSALAHLENSDIETLLLTVLPALGLPLAGGGRSPEQIVGRLVRKLRRGDPQPQIERALELLQSLSALRGPALPTLEAARALLGGERSAVGEQLAELRETIELLAALGLPEDLLVIDFGIGRGLHYYTGLIFEIDDVSGAQLCGGGRYDDLVAALGGPPTPAVGFAYGLERVLASAALPAAPAERRVLLVVDEQASYARALRVASILRGLGLVTLLDVRNRSRSSNQRDAARRSIDVLAQVEPEGLRWRDLRSGQEQLLSVELDGLAGAVREIL